jgi:hypothetical protein
MKEMVFSASISEDGDVLHTDIKIISIKPDPDNSDLAIMELEKHSISEISTYLELMYDSVSSHISYIKPITTNIDEKVFNITTI